MFDYPHTCPKIDKVISDMNNEIEEIIYDSLNIFSGFKNKEGLNISEYLYNEMSEKIKSRCDDFRDINSEMRNAAETQISIKESEIYKLENTISDLECENIKLEDRISELDDVILRLESKIEELKDN